MEANVLNPVRTITIQGQLVEVREFKALVLLGLLKRISTDANRLADKDGNLKLTTQNFAEVVLAVEGLLEAIATHATGRDRAWVETLDLSEALDLLAAVFELNREVLTKKLGGLAGAWKGIPKVPSETLPAT